MLGMVDSYGLLRLLSYLICSIEPHAIKESDVLSTASQIARFPNSLLHDSKVDFTPPFHVQALSFSVR